MWPAQVEAHSELLRSLRKCRENCKELWTTGLLIGWEKNGSPIPRTEEMYDYWGCAKIFQTWLEDRLSPQSCSTRRYWKTAFNTKFGQSFYLLMPMRLVNSPATFVPLINDVFRGSIDNFCVLYIDDKLIFSKTREGLYVHIRWVLQRLKEHKLYLSPKGTRTVCDKCLFMKS